MFHSFASVAFILIFGSMPHDRVSPTPLVWPGRDGRGRGGRAEAGKQSRMDGSADKADSKRHLAGPAEKNGLILKTNYIPLRSSFGPCPNPSQRSESSLFLRAVGIFLFSPSFFLPILIYLLLRLIQPKFVSADKFITGFLCQWFLL